MPPERKTATPIRVVYVALGFASLGLAALGVVLPLLPTTPLVLLAAACFARGSPRFHEALRRNRVFGPAIRDWEDRRAVTPRVKTVAVVLVVVTFATTIAFGVTHPWLRAGLGLLALTLLFFLLRLPSR